MPFTSGDRLGGYEILAPIGAGGMGEVYRARDTKLKREVALKVLPDAFSRDGSRVLRFQREAELLASLNHPNIAAIYGIEESNGTRALVMELVPGVTLADRIRQGAIPLEEAREIARQIAEALEYAHERGIVHRDLKPANVKITPEGAVKVLDFGLAKAFSETETAAPVDADNSPTLTIGMTAAGVILGTAAYMAPEQARGKKVDKRADIWAFGVVLYEMLTGSQLFRGETVSDLLAAVLRHQPDWNRVPVEMKPLLQRCLERDPKKRLRDIGDLPLLTEQPAPSGRQRHAMLPWICAAASLLAALAITGIHFREAPAPRPVPATFQFEPPSSLYTMVAVSPDGRYIAMSSRSSQVPLIVRPVGALEIRQLPGTDGARFPFWSPDSTYIGFSADGKLKKIAVTGGAAQTIADATVGMASWGQDGYILFGNGVGGSIERVPAAGGAPVPVKLGGPAGLKRLSQVFPDGRHFLYLLTANKLEQSGIYLGALNGAPPVRLFPDQSNAIYVPGASPNAGHILFRRGTTLVAASFDALRLKVDGNVLPLAEQVDTIGYLNEGAFSASPNGVLAYRSFTNGRFRRELVWEDRSGKILSTASKPASIGYFGTSADATRAAFQFLEGDTHADLWLADLTRGSISRLTFTEGVTYSPVWSPDGSRVAFGFYDTKKNAWGLYLKAAGGSGEQQFLTPIQGVNTHVFDWSRDGRYLVYGQEVPATKADLWLLPLEGDHKPLPYLHTAANEIDAQFSPDGRWMAYSSDESGQYQVYVQGIPASEAKWQVSPNGGVQPRWSRDGKELFFISADNMVNVVPVRTEPSFQAGDPKPLFRIEPLGPQVYTYQPSPDGQRFLVNREAAGPVQPVTVVLNWRSLLKQ